MVLARYSNCVRTSAWGKNFRNHLKGEMGPISHLNTPSHLSLKGRLALAFSGLILIVTMFSGVLLFQQHRIAVRGAALAVHENEELRRVIHLRELLVSIRRTAQAGSMPRLEIFEFRQILNELGAGLDNLGSNEIFQNLNQRFNSYVEALDNTSHVFNIQEIANRYEDTAAFLQNFIQFNQDSLYQLTASLRKEQEHATVVAVTFLMIFLCILLVISMKIITIVTEPFSQLAKFLDEVNIEDDIPFEFPRFQPEALEVSLVARSFERLLQRLHGYRALNVRRLLVEKRRADIIAASIADGIFLLRGNELLYMNPIAERILGLKPGISWKGQSILTLAEEKFKDGSTGAQAVSQAMNRTMPIEFVFEAENRKSYYLMQAQPISEELIERVQHSVTSSAEQVLDRWQANILILAQDVTVVKESQEAKSHFVATLSHEVKTPVTSLTMATRLLRKAIDQIPNPTYRALVETCASDVDRLRGLLDDLLSVSRFDTLTQRLELKEVDMSRLLRQSVQGFQVQAYERGVEMVVHLPAPGTATVANMDATKISWAISNLLINALRHTPRGGKVESYVNSDGESVEVKIRDMGPGIERHRQERIFDKFSQVYDLRVARTGGAGMGLAIAREIVVAHGGRIWVSSDPGKGADFCFTLPLRHGSIGANSQKGESYGSSTRS